MLEAITLALPSRLAFCVWRRDMESWKRFAGSFFVAALGEPILYLLAIGYGLGRFVQDINGVPYAVFLAPGIIASAAMNSASFESTFGAFTRMTEQHTYQAVLATPCSVGDLVGGDILWAATKSAASAALVLLITAVSGLTPSWLALLTVPASLLTGLMFAGMGMIVTAKAPSYDFFTYYFTLAISVMFLFSGVFFPIESLPGWAQHLAWFLPLTHAVRLNRLLCGGTLGLECLHEVAWMALVTLGAFAVAERLVRKRLVV